MYVKNYRVFNPDALVELDISETIKQAFARTDQILVHVGTIRPEVTAEYSLALKMRLLDVVQDASVDSSSFELGDMSDGLEPLKDHLGLQDLIFRFVGMHLELAQDYQLRPDETVQVTSLNHAKAFERLSYHRTKACADVLGDEQGVQLWKAVVARLLEDEKIEYERAKQERVERGEDEPTSAEIIERAIKRWTEIGLGDFTVVVFDDSKTLYRFDSCLTHEALKDSNDPDFAYLCSCYIGDAEGYNFCNRYLRRTQTLHHGDFCDELYWDPRVYHDPRQPSLEFTQKLGKEQASGGKFSNKEIQNEGQ